MATFPALKLVSQKITQLHRSLLFPSNLYQYFSGILSSAESSDKIISLSARERARMVVESLPPRRSNKKRFAQSILQLRANFSYLFLITLINIFSAKFAPYHSIMISKVYDSGVQCGHLAFSSHRPMYMYVYVRSPVAM